ncbi:hypothetical protein [Microbacterium hydrocarbonoxydans]|uniref:hypothetical protein n=1 Tax=Microbacterium hydrocarbonoxydans TaxID=273678 RepID=UPI001364898A|nr:hypothetical protein [Microbacterium hydrocarbonoxydans]
MSDPRAIPDEERPMVPEELVPRQESDDPVDADHTGAGSDPAHSEGDEDDDTVEVEDLP